MIVVSIFQLYLLLGLIFTIIFFWKGISKVDEDVEGTKFIFKLLLVPGMLVFWPIFLKKWVTK